MTTTTWGGGVGDWFIDADWQDSTPPSPVPSPGAQELVYIRQGTAIVSNATLDNIRIELETASPSSGIVPHLQLVDATLTNHMIVETRDKYKPANTPTGSQSSEIDIGGTVEFAGIMGFAQTSGYVTITDASSPATLHLQSGSGITNTSYADLHVATTTLVNDGNIVVRQNIVTIDSSSVSGSGRYSLYASGVMRFSHGVASGTVAFDSSTTTAELELDDVADFAAGITGMQAQDRIHLVQTHADAVSYSGGTLTISYLGATVATLAVTGTYAPDSFTIEQVPNFGLVNDVLITACFAEGTRIATARGDIPVEALREGDAVATPIAGGFARVQWIGHREIDLARHPHPDRVAPIRVQAHAFAPGQPCRDLLLSPDHAVYLPGLGGGTLVPIGCLVNGATIAQEFPRRIRYFHVELPRHAVLLAEHLPAESYLDCDNRSAFANAPVTQAHPDFAAPEQPGAQAIWAARACAPQQRDPTALAGINAALHRRAETLGHSLSTDPAPRLFADTTPVPLRRHGHRLAATLPAGSTRLTLLSRAASPRAMQPGATDPRRLGLAITHLTLDGTPPPASAYGPGWHGPEPGLRWTNGAACLATGGARQVDIVLAPGLMTFWEEEKGRKRFFF